MSFLKSMPVIGIAALLTAGGVSVVNAQQQVNTQLNNQVNGPPESTRNYGPQQFELLPSERRFAFERSGMLPSEYRMNLESIGPLAPQGSVEAIEPQSLLQQELRLPPPVLYNPYYVKPLPANANAPVAPPPLPSSDSFYLRRSNMTPSSSSLTPGRIDQNVWQNPAADQESTVTYYLPKKGKPSPSIAPGAQPPGQSGPATQPAQKAGK